MSALNTINYYQNHPKQLETLQNDIKKLKSVLDDDVVDYHFRTEKSNPFSNPLDYVINKSTPPLKHLTPKIVEKPIRTMFERGNYYKSISKSKETLRKDFSKFKWFVSSRTGEIVKFKNMSLNNLLEQEASRLQFAIQQIQHQNSDSESLFMTLTLNSKQHSHFTENGKKVVNKNFDGDLIEKGYKYLLNVQQMLDRKFRKKKNLGKGLPYVRIVEPHKDWTCHLHIQYWVEKDKIELVQELIQSTLDNQVETSILGVQSDIKHIENQDNSNVSSYITKYLLKTQEKHNAKSKNDYDPRNINSIDGWKRYHKIRMFSSSRLAIPKKLYNQVVAQTRDNYIKKLKYDNLGSYAVDNIKYISSINDSVKNEIRVKIKNDIKKPDLTIVRHSKVFLDLDIFDNIIKKSQQTKLQIFDKKSNMVHNSKWWVLKFLEFDESSLIDKILNYDNYDYCNNINYENIESKYYNPSYDKLAFDIY